MSTSQDAITIEVIWESWITSTTIFKTKMKKRNQRKKHLQTMLNNSKVDAINLEKLGINQLTQNIWRTKMKVRLMIILVKMREVLGRFLVNSSTVVWQDIEKNTGNFMEALIELSSHWTRKRVMTVRLFAQIQKKIKGVGVFGLYQSMWVWGIASNPYSWHDAYHWRIIIFYIYTKSGPDIWVHYYITNDDTVMYDVTKCLKSETYV